MIVSNPLVRAAVTVSLFWWVALTAVAVAVWPHAFFSLEGPGIMAWHLWRAVLTLLICTVLGCLAVCGWHTVRFFRTMRSLQGDTLRGMTSSVGPLPLPRSALPKVRAMPSWLFDERRVEHGAALMRWLQQNQERHPAHARLASALVRSLCVYEGIRASPVVAGQGRRSLLDHSCRVAFFAIEDSHGLDVRGLQTDRGLLPWRDPGFKLDPLDPLIPIIGLAHDFGKVDTYELDETGGMFSSRPGHDKVGARLLALLDEVHGLPPSDRAAIFMAVAHHHSPSDYPVAKDGRLADDRPAALLMLLMHADARAKTCERRPALSSGVAAGPVAASATVVAFASNALLPGSCAVSPGLEQAPGNAPKTLDEEPEERAASATLEDMS